MKVNRRVMKLLRETDIDVMLHALGNRSSVQRLSSCDGWTFTADVVLHNGKRFCTSDAFYRYKTNPRLRAARALVMRVLKYERGRIR